MHMGTCIYTVVIIYIRFYMESPPIASIENGECKDDGIVRMALRLLQWPRTLHCLAL